MPHSGIDIIEVNTDTTLVSEETDTELLVEVVTEIIEVNTDTTLVSEETTTEIISEMERGPPGSVSSSVIETRITAVTHNVSWAGFNLVRITLDDPTTTINLSGAEDGQKLVLDLTQGAGGGKLVTWGAEVNFGTDLPSTVLSTGAGVRDQVGFIYHAPSGKYDVVAFMRGY